MRHIFLENITRKLRGDKKKTNPRDVGKRKEEYEGGESNLDSPSFSLLSIGFTSTLMTLVGVSMLFSIVSVILKWEERGLANRRL